MFLDTNPLMKFEGRLQLVHEAEEDAVKWLEFIASTAFMKAESPPSAVLSCFGQKAVPHDPYIWLVSTAQDE